MLFNILTRQITNPILSLICNNFFAQLFQRFALPLVLIV
jgi:hypothetical protein